MQITIKKLDPIEEASVDLSKDLIVITGQNNTGKTYLMYVINYILYIIEKRQLLTNSDIPIELGKNVDELLLHGSTLFTNKDIVDLLNKYEQLVKQIFYDNKYKEYKIAHFLGNYDSSDSQSKIDVFGIYKNIDMSAIFIDYTVTTSKGNNAYTLTKRANSYQIDLFNNNIGELTREDENKTLHYLLHTFIQSVNPTKNYNLFTTERTAIDIFVNRLFVDIPTGLKINAAVAKKWGQYYSSLYPYPIQDAIHTSADLKNTDKHISVFNGLANELEKELLDGKIVINKNGDLQYKLNKSDKLLNIAQTSSIVKSLAGLSFYLRHEAEKGDIIMIDEPELSLHPDNQRRIARFLGRLVNEGFKVIVSTHSDYIIKELNLLIMLSKKSNHQADLLQKYGYSTNQLLTPSQIQALFFRQGQGIPENVAITETGFTIASIDDTIEQIENTTEDVYFQLFEQEEVEI